MFRRGRTIVVASGLAIWLAATVTTLVLIARYKATPGELGSAPDAWPGASAIQPTPGLANVVLFAHPQCPCTKASMTELARLADELGPTAAIHVVLVRPADAEVGFEEGTLADRARAIRAHVVV